MINIAYQRQRIQFDLLPVFHQTEGIHKGVRADSPVLEWGKIIRAQLKLIMPMIYIAMNAIRMMIILKNKEKILDIL